MQESKFKRSACAAIFLCFVIAGAVAFSATRLNLDEVVAPAQVKLPNVLAHSAKPNLPKRKVPIGPRLLRQLTWEKKGLVIPPDPRSRWRSHLAGMACVHKQRNGYRAYLAGSCASTSAMSIGWVVLSDDFEIVQESPEAIVSPRSGNFDDRGTLAPFVVRVDDQTLYMYYVGWTQGGPLELRMEPGLAISNDDGATWQRPVEGSFMPKDAHDPHGIGTVCVLIDEPGRWRMWYTSIQPPVDFNGQKVTNRYFIKHAESADGIHWHKPPNNTALDIDGRSIASKPMIVREPDGMRMFYSFKQAHSNRLLPDEYRICEAHSMYGRMWYDQGVVLDVSASGWDSEMVEYAWVIPQGDEYLMFYSGNGFGATGTGLAIGRYASADVEPTVDLR
ncbi:MAG: hypothetical protein AB7O26_01685 [Planctomycetaceae bacterium]